MPMPWMDAPRAVGCPLARDAPRKKITVRPALDGQRVGLLAETVKVLACVLVHDMQNELQSTKSECARMCVQSIACAYVRRGTGAVDKLPVSRVRISRFLCIIERMECGISIVKPWLCPAPVVERLI